MLPPEGAAPARAERVPPAAGEDVLATWDYPLPNHLIARTPPTERDGGRLLVVDRTLADRTVADLPSLLQPDDLLVLNDVRVRRARLRAERATGGAVEVLVLRADGDVGEALLRPARKLREGEVLRAGSGQITVIERLDEGRARVAFSPSLRSIEAEVGEMPLPPYLNRAATSADDARYQTVFHRPGTLEAAAAPTAGLHLSSRLLAEIEARGVDRAHVTLEVGLGTFRPLTPEQLASGQLHPERYDVPEATWSALELAQRQGRRVVAVGTTVVRTLESATGPGPGETRILLQEGWRPRRVGALFTNFHLPRSSLLLLVAGFAGRERTLAAYRHAVAGEYRFFSYGDACFFPAPG
ncbi:S-adenosylmethionine:tRNA ribosyltransferase-isomerase [Deltaproteobacteria bacterium]|nr:S-adenosylmethionine:tRNA ribosyltransferase-isomerase [Deltaproteobacteria bacterium]